MNSFILTTTGLSSRFEILFRREDITEDLEGLQRLVKDALWTPGVETVRVDIVPPLSFLEERRLSSHKVAKDVPALGLNAP